MVGISGKSGYGISYGNQGRQKFSYAQDNAKWAERRRASNEQYLASQANVANMFTTNSNASAGIVELTFQRVSARFQEELAAKAQERQDKLDSLDISV